MFKQEAPTRQLPGIFSYLETFSSKSLAYLIFFGSPTMIAFLSSLLKYLIDQTFNFQYFYEMFLIFFLSSLGGVIMTHIFYVRKAPILRLPPKGWTIQLNTFFNTIIGGSYLIGQIISIYFINITFQEVFLMLGIILAYILAFVIYFSFTTVEKSGYLFLSLTQPVAIIILYSIFTEQVSILFFFENHCIFLQLCIYIFNFIC